MRRIDPSWAFGKGHGLRCPHCRSYAARMRPHRSHWHWHRRALTTERSKNSPRTGATGTPSLELPLLPPPPPPPPSPLPSNALNGRSDSEATTLPSSTFRVCIAIAPAAHSRTAVYVAAVRMRDRESTDNADDDDIAGGLGRLRDPAASRPRSRHLLDLGRCDGRRSDAVFLYASH